jgi:folate-binding protein YgfZ
MIFAFDTRPAHAHAGLYVSSHPRSLISVSGEDRASFLQGLLCQDVVGQPSGTLRYGFFLNPKARILFDSWIGVLPDRILLSPSLFTPSGEEAFLAHLKKYLFFRTRAALASLTRGFVMATLVGPDAPTLAAPLFSEESGMEGLKSLASGGFAFLHPSSSAFESGRGPWIDLWIPSDAAEKILAALSERVADRGGQRLDDAGIEVYRVERGIPTVPAELNLGHFPAEAGLDSLAVSYNKGCYVGQEPVTRLKFQGQLSRKLSGVRFSGSAPAEGPLPRPLLAASDGSEAGILTSLVSSDLCGTLVGLAYLKRGQWETGTALVDGEGNRFEVAELPLSPEESPF